MRVCICALSPPSSPPDDCNAVLVKVRLAYRPAEQPRTAKAYEVEVQPLLEMPANLEEIILPNIGEELLNMMPAMQDEVILPPMGEELLSHPQPAARIIQPSQLEQLGPFPAPELEVGIAGRPGITAPMLPDDLRLPDFELPLPEPVEAPLIPEQAEAPEIPLPEFGEREELPEEAGRRKRRARAKQPVFDTQTILSSDHIKATLRDASDTMMDRPVKTARVTNVMTSVMHAPALSLPRALRNTWAKLAWLPDRGIAGQFPVQSESLLPDVEQLRAELSASRHEIPIHVPSPLAPIQPPQMSKAPSPIPMMPPLDTLREEYEPLMPEIPEVEQRPSPPPVSARVPVPREPVREQAPEEAERVNKFHQYLYDEHFDSHGAKVRDSVSFFSVTADSSKSIAAKAFYYSLCM